MIKGDVLSVVDRVYATASGDGEWGDALAELKQLLGFPAAALRIFDPQRSRPIVRIWHGFSENYLRGYDAYYGRVSPGEKFFRDHPEARMFYTYLSTPEAEIDRNEYFTWKAREIGLCYVLGGFTRPGLPFSARVGLNRPRSVGHPTQDEIALYARIFDHIERALLLAWRLGGAPLAAADADLLLEQRPHGAVLLDRGGRVLFANRAARTMAARGDAFALSGEAITALRQADHAALQRLITSVIRENPLRPLSRGGAMRLPRRTGKRDYAVLVTPLRAHKGLFVTLAPAVLVTITDPAAAVSPRTVLRDLYGLTPAELRLAERLVLGETPKEAATELGVAVATVREHLSALLRKTQTRRQAELVRLIQSLS